MHTLALTEKENTMIRAFILFSLISGPVLAMPSAQFHPAPWKTHKLGPSPDFPNMCKLCCAVCCPCLEPTRIDLP